MPSGYTYEITEGEGITFERFAISCSRAFLARMRDVGLDVDPETVYATIGDKGEFEKQLKEWKDRLNFLVRMKDNEIEKEVEDSYNKEVAMIEAMTKEAAEKKKKYEAMLAKVLAWEPPTEGHRGLKNFMTTQIRESIEFDCKGNYIAPKKRTGKEWFDSNVETAQSQIEYYKERVKESKVNEGLIWIQQLKASLKEPK